MNDQTPPKTVAFYAPVSDMGLLDRVDFYRADIEALEALGLDVHVANTLWSTNWGADVFYVWWWSRALPVALWARLRGRPVLITGTFNWGTSAPGDYAARPRLQRLIIRMAARLATRNLLPSGVETCGIRAGLGLTNVVRFPHRVRPPSPPGPPSSRLQGLGLEATRFAVTLAWSGAANLRRKCVYETIEAFELVADRHPDVVLVVGGNEGDAFQELCGRAAMSRHRERLSVLGLVSEAEREWLLHHCAVFVSPSRFEGFGLAIAEAAAHGRPVVTTAVGALPEVLGPTGALYCASGEPAAIATELSRALTDPVAALAAADAGRQAASRFTLGAKVEQLRSVLHSVGVDV